MLPIQRCLHSACRSIVLAMLVMLFVQPAFAQGIGPGSKVTVIHWNTELKAGEKVVHTVGVGTNLDVDKVNGDWLWIANYKGYVKLADVVPYDQAVQHFTAKIRANPESSSAYHDRACVWSDRGECDIAIKDFTEAIRLDPHGTWRSYVGRGRALNRQGDTTHALSDLNEAIRINVDDSEAWLLRAEIRRDRYEWDEAQADLDAAQLHNGKPFDVWWVRTITSTSGRNYVKAVEDSVEYRGTGAKSNLINITLGQSYYFSGRPYHALRELEYFENWRSGPAYSDAPYTVRTWAALSKSAIGQHEAAAQLFQKCLLPESKCPDNYKVFYAHFLSSCPSDDLRDGRLALRLALSAKVENEWLVERHDIQAMAHAECGDFPAAIAAQKEAIALAESRNYHADYIAGLRERLKLYEAGLPYRHPVYAAEPKLTP